MARRVEFATGVGGTGTRGLADEHYKSAYNKGWGASQRFASASGWTSALEGADSKGLNDAWYDGYADHSAGRDKWHMPNCPGHHNGPDGCGQA
jgi:hypothetical protein